MGKEDLSLPTQNLQSSGRWKDGPIIPPIAINDPGALSEGGILKNEGERCQWPSYLGAMGSGCKGFCCFQFCLFIREVFLLPRWNLPDVRCPHRGCLFASDHRLVYEARLGKSIPCSNRWLKPSRRIQCPWGWGTGCSTSVLVSP